MRAQKSTSNHESKTICRSPFEDRIVWLHASASSSNSRISWTFIRNGASARIEECYVLLAQAALAADEKRDALRHSRPAIESLTDRLWTWLGKRGDGRLELKLGGPRAKWELNNKCMKLRGALGRMPNPHPAMPAVLGALDDILGISGGSIEWGYLNSGTHDAQRDNEFDRAAVRRIVDAVTVLDAGLSQLQQGR